MLWRLIVALETRLNEQEQEKADQRPNSRRKTRPSNSEEENIEETNPVTQVSPVPTTALTPVSIDIPPWSGSISNLVTPAVTAEPTGDDVARALMPTRLERVPVALHLTVITCSDL